MDAEAKATNAAIILEVLAAKGGDGRFLRAIAGRESGLNHAIQHRLPADANGSLKAWRRNEALFAENPWYDQVELWDHGKGLFGMMPANHLQRWDPTAHPDALFNPWVASVAAARLVRSCMRGGAQTWADIDQCWATGKSRRTESWGPRRERMMARLSKLGYPPGLVDAVPEPGDWGTGPQDDQVEVLWSIAQDFDGLDDDNEDDEYVDDLADEGDEDLVVEDPGERDGAGEGRGKSLWIGLGLLGLGGVGLALASTQRGR